jgi:membrane peptidoglycan carboxypeptidase
VRAWLAAPPVPTTTTVWSAPPLVRIGEPYPLDALVGDLVAAGYERGAGARREDTFVVDGSTVRLNRARHVGPGWVIPAGEVRITLDGDHVSATSPADGVSLLPVPLATVGDLESRRDPVALDAVSPFMVPALLAIEDARFHDHVGVDPIGILRALVRTAIYGDLQGGSTLTQQLAKNLFLGPERTVQRKLKEVFYAAALESELDKDALLELYLSEVYLGHHGGMPLYGVEQAARAWFGKSAAHLTAGEAATMAGVIASPNVYSPLRSHEHALARRDQVIERMVYVRALTEDQAAAARREPLATMGAGPSASWQAPWVVDEALEQATEALGPRLSQGEAHIHTHIQLHLQRAAQRAVTEGLAELAEAHDDAADAEAALVVVRARDGGVLAMVGGRDFVKSPFHRAVDARRQAGSTVKPLTALGAFDLLPDVTPATLLQDAPLSRRFDGRTWTPTNYDGVHLGPVSVRRTIEGSRNVPAVLLSERLGAGRQKRLFQSTGLTGATDLPSAALGAFPTTPLELAGAYTVFPTNGTVHAPVLLRVITGPDGDVLFEPKPDAHSVADPVPTALTRKLLQGVMTHGTARGARLSGNLGGKTGTTDRGRDAWFVGFDPTATVSVWVGRDKADLGLSGGEAALPIWADFARDVGMPRGRFTDPAGIAATEVCTATGRPPDDACEATHTEWLATPR